MTQQTHRRRGSRWLWLAGLAVGLAAGTLVALELADLRRDSAISVERD